ncbi:MAG: tetratricopeptide repeat protein [Gammaproteobacteria bacterium]|nr:tetratricopeptide repeat protein [Gammaproteobacteria bacterium]MCF6364523.1 tetratricopeptide repeat protein [Gammaproteobacteria bacterium]
MAKKTPDNIIKIPDRRAMENLMKPFGRASQDSALDEAQEIMYQAWESGDPAERVELAERALQVSADCADAWTLLAEESADSLPQALAYYQKAVEAGERALGSQAFEEDKGHFWGLLETRPYMRASLGLAQCLWEKGDRNAAIQRYQQMLELNPNDNQGVRQTLLGCLMDEKRHDEAEVLILAYPDDWSACWRYARALIAYRYEQDTKNSRDYRKQALESNKHVPAYLAGKRKMPKYLPDYVGVGDKNEAIAYVLDNRQAWLDTPGAIPWLLKGKG